MADLGSIPPWLNVGPQNFVQAAEAGQHIALQRAELAQRASQAAAQLAASQQNAATEHQLQRDQIAANFQRAQAQAAMTKAYHDAQLGVAQNRLTLEAQKAQQAIQEKAAILADRQGYAAAVSAGMKPAEALAKFPHAWTPGIVTGAAKSPEETITKRTTMPAGATEPGKEAEPASRGLLWLNQSWLGAHPARPAVPPSPAVSTTESVKVPVGTSAAAAFSAGQPVQPAPAPANIPAAAINFLKQNPHTADEFDAKFGAGASQQYLAQ